MELQRPHTESRADRASQHPVPNPSGSHANAIVRIGDEPIDLISRAYDALDQGILVVSQDGLISHYNAAYAQLRNIGTVELLGKPLEILDRRHSITAYLRTGKMPAVKSMDFEQRRNRETVVPIREDGRLLGSMVLVTPFSASPTDASQRRRTVNAKSPWTALYAIDDIVGESPAIQYARQLVLSAARVDSSVLLLGESGTGKELFAHALHMASKRSQGPFVPVDCSAITRDLLEAELFGYAPGAFTGATKDGKPGKFELAEGGTVFLDEIGEMPMEMQAKLLRVLQERRIVRVGGTTPIEINFRLIAATNRQLEGMVEEKRFRHDLLYRLDVVRIEIPALRERGDDIAVLLEHAWKTKSREREHSVILTPHREAFYNREKLVNHPVGKDSPWDKLRFSRYPRFVQENNGTTCAKTSISALTSGLLTSKHVCLTRQAPYPRSATWCGSYAKTSRAVSLKRCSTMLTHRSTTERRPLVPSVSGASRLALP